MSSTLRLGVIGLMLLTVLVLGIFILNFNRPADVQFPVSGVQPMPVPFQIAWLVAEHPLPAGTLARDTDFRSVLGVTLPANAIADSPEARASLRGSLIRAWLDAGVPITYADVLRTRDRGFVASVLNPGNRAVSVGVDPVSGVAGLIWPGDRVDIILTQDLDKETAAYHTLGETVMVNIRVIAIDQEIVQGAPADNAAAGKLVRTVTLEVDPAQAEKIAVAVHIGKLTLSIRAANDQDANLSNRTTYGADVSPALSRIERTERPAATGANVTVFHPRS
jgi:pilus assembly protein CpaB